MNKEELMTAENNRPALLLVEDDAEIREQMKWARIWLNLAIALVVTAACFAAPAFPQSLSDAPALPQVYLDTTYAPPTGGMTITINAGGDLQEALNNVTCGDTIRLQAGGTFTGPFILPNKPCTDWIYIRPDTADSNLPPPGTRITPSDANVIPKIMGAGMPVIALQTSAMAHHFRFIGIECIPQSGTYATSLIRLGAGETDAVLLPHDIVFDRCYIHGDPTVGGRRGIALNSARTAVVDSYFSDWKENGGESQAVAGWNGSGPFKIVNNYVEAAAVNLMFGGADPSIPNLVPSDIEIRNNYFFKPLSWKGSSWTVKNLFELKNAQRVLVEGNVFENIWTAAQDGAAIVMKSANQDGTAPWSTVRDITFRKNIIRRASVGIKTAGITQGPAMPSVRILVQDNLIIVESSLGLGRPYEFYNDTQDITVDHNTTDGSGDFLIAADACPPT